MTILFGVMKLMTWLLSPLALGLAGFAWGGFLMWRGKRRCAVSLTVLAFAWLWLWSSPWFYLALGGPLEQQYPPVPVETLPQADAIVVLGGGLGSPTPYTVYPELYQGSDRGWQAARCFHAGKAPFILFSGVGEGLGMKQFLVDLGVPATNIVLESESKNTYENGLFVRAKLKELKAHKVILVTSAWHLRRAMLAFKKMKVAVIPSGCDYEALSSQGTLTPGMQMYYLPAPDVLMRSTAVCKEIIGYWAYWLYFQVFDRN